MKKSFKKVKKILKKVFLLLLISATLFISTKLTINADIIGVNYGSTFLFAYNDTAYVLIDSDLTGATPLVGVSFTSYDTQFVSGWDVSAIDAGDYVEITGVAKSNVFNGSYGSTSGASYTDYFRLFQLNGGSVIIPLNNITSTAIIYLTNYSQYPIIYDATGTPSSMTLKQYFDLLESGYTNGYFAGYGDSYDDGYDNGVADGFDAGVLDQADEITQAYSDGYDAGAIASNEDAYDAGYSAGLSYQANDFYDNIESWLVPAIIVVLFLGGFIAFARKKRDSVE